MNDIYTMHEDICKELTAVYRKKNSDYGDSFAKLRREYPEAICIRLQDKMNRLKSLMVEGKNQQVADESIEDTLMDIANYAIMEIIERKIDKE